MNKNDIRKSIVNSAVISEIGTLGLYAHNVLDVGTASKITLGLGALTVGYYVADAFYDVFKDIVYDFKRAVYLK